MAVGSAQIPFFACRAVGLGGQQRGGAVLVGDIGGETNASPCASSCALHRMLGARDEDEGGLAAVTVGRVVLAAQRDVAAGDDRRQRRGALGLVGRDRLDAGKPDLAAVVEAKAARIDHGGDAAFALRLERAGRRERWRCPQAAATPAPRAAAVAGFD